MNFRRFCVWKNPKVDTGQNVIGSSRVGTEKGHLAAEIEGKDLLQKHIYTTAIEPALHTPQLHRRLIHQKNI